MKVYVVTRLFRKQVEIVAVFANEDDAHNEVAMIDSMHGDGCAEYNEFEVR
jgi:hypothetical protein